MSELNPVPTTRTALHDAVACILSCVLQSDNALQKQAIDRLKKIEVIEDYPLVLCQIIGSEEEANEERHIAAIFLKNYLEEIYFHSRKNEALFQKGLGKTIILRLMEYMNNKFHSIKEMIAYNIALLLGLGFWSDLTVLLNHMLMSEDPVQISNGIHILHKAIDTQFLTQEKSYLLIDYHWFDVLLGVFKMKTICSQARAHSIHPMFMLIKYLRPNPNFLPECLTRLTEEIEKALNEPYSTTSEFAFKFEIIKCLNNCVDEFNEYCNIFIPQVLPAIGNLLTICCEQYKKVIQGSASPPKDSTEGDEAKTFFDLVVSILEFILNLIDMTYFDILIEDLNNLIYSIYVFMACHNDMENHLFINSVQKNFHWTLRDTCMGIILHALEQIENHQRNGKAAFFQTMHNVFQKLNNELESHENSDICKVYYMSRVTESMIYGTGLIKEKNRSTVLETFPLENYINHWTNLFTTGNLMLQGRIIWAGGVFCNELSPNVMECHLKNIIQSLTTENKYLLSPSAQALGCYFKEYKNMSLEKQYLISRNAKQILDCLVSISRKLNDHPFHHCLHALGYLIKCQKSLAQENVEQLEDILIKAMMNSYADPDVMKEVNFVCAKMAQAQTFKVFVHDKFFSFIHHVIEPIERRQTTNLDKAFDLLNIICLYSSTIDEYSFLEIFASAANRLSLNTERDMEVDESAGNLLITLVVKFQNQLKYITQTPKGQAVMSQFPQLLDMLMQPDIEFPGNVLGKLVILAIFSLPEIMQPHHETILRNVISKSANPNIEKIRSTWSIFIFICMIRTSDTFNYLSILPGPTGGSALNFILKLWKPEYFHNIDPIERKILVISITHIIQHCSDHAPDYGKLKEILIPFDGASNEEESLFNGLQYLYYLIIQCLLYEDKLRNIIPAPSQPYDFQNFGEDVNKKKEEDEIFLFHSHPFNIDIVNHVVHFLKDYEVYYVIVKHFLTQTSYSRLKELGCNLPQLDMNVQEDME